MNSEQEDNILNSMDINTLGQCIPNKKKLNDDEDLILLYDTGHNINRCLQAGLILNMDGSTDIYSYGVAHSIEKIFDIFENILKNVEGKDKEELIKIYTNKFYVIFPKVKHLYDKGKKKLDDDKKKIDEYVSILSKFYEYIPKSYNNKNLKLLMETGCDIYKCSKAGLEIINSGITEEICYNVITIEETDKILLNILKNSNKNDKEVVKNFITYFRSSYFDIKYLHDKGKKYFDNIENKERIADIYVHFFFDL